MVMILGVQLSAAQTTGHSPRGYPYSAKTCAGGAVVFRQACVLGLEGIVAKRRDSHYRSGRCREWIKIKNPAHPAIERAMLIALSKRARR